MEALEVLGDGLGECRNFGDPPVDDCVVVLCWARGEPFDKGSELLLGVDFGLGEIAD